MARARCPNSIEAEKLYFSGMKLVEIAKKLDVPEGTVRRWKSTQKWGACKESKGERSKITKANKANVRKRGAPKGNKNAWKHGGYSGIYWGSLTDEEREMIKDLPDDVEELLYGQVQLSAVREYRLMKALNQYYNVKGGQYVSGIMSLEEKRKFETPAEEELYKELIREKVKKGERLPGRRCNVQTTTGASIDLVARLEKELNSAQSQKTREIDTLFRLRLENRKMEEANRGSELVDDWIAGIVREDEEGGSDNER